MLEDIHIEMNNKISKLENEESHTWTCDLWVKNS